MFNIFKGHKYTHTRNWRLKTKYEITAISSTAISADGDLSTPSSGAFHPSLAAFAASSMAQLSSASQRRENYAAPQTAQARMRKLDARGLFQCTQCGYLSKKRYHLTRHLRMHSREFFQCQFCTSRFYEKCRLVTHVRLHHANVLL